MNQTALVVVGAILGFAGSTVGTIYTNRVGDRRTMRTRIYCDLMPNLDSSDEHLRSKAADEIYRAGVVVGGKDKRLATRIREELRHGGKPFADAVREYRGYLERKLDWKVWAPWRDRHRPSA